MEDPEHTQTDNIAVARAWGAIEAMKKHMTKNIATPSVSQGAVVTQLSGHVQMALPKKPCSVACLDVIEQFSALYRLPMDHFHTFQEI